jgi:hypothetical protein
VRTSFIWLRLSPGCVSHYKLKKENPARDLIMLFDATVGTTYIDNPRPSNSGVGKIWILLSSFGTRGNDSTDITSFMIRKTIFVCLHNDMIWVSSTHIYCLYPNTQLTHFLAKLARISCSPQFELKRVARHQSYLAEKHGRCQSLSGRDYLLNNHNGSSEINEHSGTPKYQDRKEWHRASYWELEPCRLPSRIKSR